MANELHRVCWCGETPKLIGSPHDPKRRGMFVRCPGCGCRSITCSSISRAWYAWDYYDLQEDEENLTIYDMIRGEGSAGGKFGALDGKRKDGIHHTKY